MARPTQEQLEKINRFAKTNLNPDDIEVFRNLMIDTLPVKSHGLIISEELLKKFEQDVKNGVPQMLSHITEFLPVGRVFDGEIVDEEVDGMKVKTLYGEFYIPRGVKVTGYNITTDDLIEMINKGILTDTSIGFFATKIKCNICGNDIRNFLVCPHIPNQEYDVDGQKVICYGIVEGDGELTENSLVYSGACERAVVLSKDGSEIKSVKREGIKVEDVKRIPLNAKMMFRFSKNGGMEIYVDELMDEDEIGVDDPIEIDNSAESADNRPWGEVDLENLRKRIMRARNYRSLVREAYLVVEDGYESAPSQHLKYPHHVIKNGKLVVSRTGVRAAKARLMQNDPNNQAALRHLRRHERELGMGEEESVIGEALTVEELEFEIESLKEEIQILQNQVKELREMLAEAEKEKEELSMIEAKYKQRLISDYYTSAVLLNEKFEINALKELSIEELETKVKDVLDKVRKTYILENKISETAKQIVEKFQIKEENESIVKDDVKEETEEEKFAKMSYEEQQEYFVKKAREYMKENHVTMREALREIYKKYKKLIKSE